MSGKHNHEHNHEHTTGQATVHETAHVDPAQAAAQAAAEKEQEKARKAAEKQAEKEKKAAEREANKMPEQNGIRRPKPATICGQVWAEADRLSNDLGQATPVRNLLDSLLPKGMKEGNIKAEYARWRKFNGVTGRIALPKPEAEPAQTEGTESK